MSNPFRFAMIGAGGFSGAHIKSAIWLKQNGVMEIEVAAVVSRTGQHDEVLRKRFGDLNYTTDLDAVLADPTIDAVVVCVPHDVHADLAIRAAAAGKHLLVEKPLALNAKEGQDIADMCQANQVMGMVGQCARYSRQIATLKAELATGRLGDIHAVRMDVMQAADAFIPKNHWYRDGEKGGGILRSVAVHRIDLLRFLLGDVRQVRAWTRSVSPDFVHGADDLAMAHLELENGALCELFAMWTAFRVPYVEGLMIFGEKGTVHACPELSNAVGRIHIADEKESPAGDGTFPSMLHGFRDLPEVDLPSEDPVCNQLAHFAECCTNGTPPLSSCADNVQTLKIVDALYASAAQHGTPIALS